MKATYEGFDLSPDNSVSYTIEMVAVGGELLTLQEAGAQLDFDTLLALGLCECGQRLDGHPPVPKPDTRSWMSQRNSDQPWRNTLTGRVLTPAQRVYAHHDGRGHRPCKGCPKVIPEDRARNALYCSAECRIRWNAEAQQRQRTAYRRMTG